jgi:hypothetical protein
MHRNRSHGPTPSVAEPRRPLLLAVRSFVQAARDCPGVLGIALVGSLTTAKAVPKDADVLVTIDGTMDLANLARAGRRLKGLAQTINLGADIFLAMRAVTTSVAFAITVIAARAGPASPSIAAAVNTSTTTFMLSRYQMNCLPHRRSSCGQTLCGGSWFRLMSKQSC